MNNPQTDLEIRSSWTTYKRLLQYTKRYWKAFAIGVLGFLLNAQAEWVFADLFKYVIDAIQSQDQSKKDLFPLAIVASFALRGLGTFMGTFGFSYVARNVVYALRKELFQHILNLPVEYYHANAPGYVISKVTYVVDQVTGAATEALKVLVREGLTVICLLGYLFYLNWRLSFLFFGVAPFIAVIVSSATKRFQKQSKRVQNTMGDVSHITSEAVNAYLAVKTFGGENYEHNRFDEASIRNLNQGLKMVKTSSINTPVVQLLVAAGMSAVVWVALRPNVAGQISPGEFIAFLVAAGMLVKPVRQLTDVNAALQRGIAAADSLFLLMDSPAEQNKGTHSPQRVAGKIEFKNISFAYSEESGSVLKDINFTIQPGQTVALVGRSGSGKSTLANLIPRFFSVTKGELLIDDVPIGDYELAALRRQIAIVSQKIALFNDTVYHNIAYGSLEGAPEEKIEEAARIAHAMEFIEKMPAKMQTQVGTDGVQLSGGQRQRIAIARAILKDAPILIMDEATSALDTESERYIQDALEKVMANRTTLVIAHRLSTIEKADIIFVMDQGQIVEAGSHTELLAKNGYYAQLQKMQQIEGEDVIEESTSAPM